MTYIITSNTTGIQFQHKIIRNLLLRKYMFRNWEISGILIYLLCDKKKLYRIITKRFFCHKEFSFRKVGTIILTVPFSNCFLTY